jgi:hypothetical protein
MTGVDINQKFDSILLNCKIIREISYDKAVRAIRDFEKNLTQESRVGLYGVGEETEALLYFISYYTTDFKIYACFDKVIRNYKYKKIVQNSTVYPIECISDMDVDYIILGSYTYRQVFIDNLNTVGYQGKVIDLYGYLELYLNDHFADYEMVYKTRQAYLGAEGFDKIELLQKLIKEYLLIKDFENAFYYIEVYIKNQYSEHERYEELWKELNLLLQEIKVCIKERNKKDIIINWVDALSYYDVPLFPFLSQKQDEGVWFENAYTVMPWTTETTKTILFGEYPIEGKLFLREFLSMDNVKLLQILSENGYGFGYCGMPKFAKLFDESVITPVGMYENKFSSSIKKQWDALGILCRSEMPMCILIHTLRETHQPYICGETDTFMWFASTEADWSHEECRKQAEVSGKYINNQLAFYEKFYGEKAVEIYMSDHGRVGNSPMNEKKIHVMLSVSGNGIPHDKITPLFSLVKVPDLIKKIIINDQDWNSLTSDYVLIENLDVYSEKLVQETLSGHFSKNEMYQSRGIVTLTDKYYFYAYGKEYYYNGQENLINEINNPQYAERIQILKKLCGDEFIDIFQFDKFKYSRMLYENSNVDLISAKD